MTSQRNIPVSISNMPSRLKGAYVLEFKIPKNSSLKIGRLGEIDFHTGYYYYIGSALNGLKSRMTRHILGTGKSHWHIDYLTKNYPISRAWCVITNEKIESEIAHEAEKRLEIGIKRFGCSDSPKAVTHLFKSKKQFDFKRILKRYGRVVMVMV